MVRLRLPGPANSHRLPDLSASAVLACVSVEGLPRVPTLPPELPKTWMPSRPLFSTTLPWTVVAIVAGSRRIPMSWLFVAEKPMLLSRMMLFSMMLPLEAAADDADPVVGPVVDDQAVADHVLVGPVDEDAVTPAACEPCSHGPRHRRRRWRIPLRRCPPR